MTTSPVRATSGPFSLPFSEYGPELPVAQREETMLLLGLPSESCGLMTWHPTQSDAFLQHRPRHQLAVPVGFEPTVGDNPHNFSRVAP